MFGGGHWVVLEVTQGEEQANSCQMGSLKTVTNSLPWSIKIEDTKQSFKNLTYWSTIKKEQNFKANIP